MNKLFFSAIMLMLIVILLSCGLIFSRDNQIRNADDLSKIVLRGSINVTDNKLRIASNALWVRGEKSEVVKFAKIEKRVLINVDIINCAGYLASAKAIYNTELTYWQLELIPETVVADAIEKVKQCLQYPEIDYVSSSAFAVSPIDDKRKQIKLNKLSKPSLLTLPVSVQTWAHTDGIGNWADTDGDGKVDLLSVSGKCGTSEENICTRILSWTGSSWTEIAYSKPA